MAQGLKQASKRAIYEANVQSLDKLGSGRDLFEQQLSVIENAAAEFIERVQRNIQQADMVVSGKIEDLQIQSENNQVNIYGNPWLIYQDRGVNGSKEKKYNTPHSYTDKMPPVEVFIDYVKAKNLQLRNEPQFSGKESPFKDLSEDDKIRKTAWAMAMKVYKEGFKPRYIYSKEIPKLVEDLQNQLTDFAIQQIVQNIEVKDSAKGIIINL